jgi:hypothetical protein
VLYLLYLACCPYRASALSCFTWQVCPLQSFYLLYYMLYLAGCRCRALPFLAFTGRICRSRALLALLHALPGRLSLQSSPNRHADMLTCFTWQVFCRFRALMLYYMLYVAGFVAAGLMLYYMLYYMLYLAGCRYRTRRT